MSSNRIVFTLLILVLAISSCLRADDLDEYMGMFSKRGKILEIDINELSEFAFAEHVQCINRLVDIVDSIKGDLIVISTYDQDNPLYDYIFFKLAQEDVFANCLARISVDPASYAHAFSVTIPSMISRKTAQKYSRAIDSEIFIPGI